MKTQLLFASFLLTTVILSAQDKYFQQKVNYKIDVELNDKKNELYAFENIEYFNNSDDTLKFLYFHLWPNAYKNTNTEFAKQNLNLGRTRFHRHKKYRGFIDSLDFKVNNKKVKWNIYNNIEDICILHLNTPLEPHKSINISTPFHVKLPKSISRLGYAGDTYQITQWYPKPAVYDKNGWNQMSYLDMGEFYSEFGDFLVNIKIPQNYVVGASGELLTEKEKIWLIGKATKTEKLIAKQKEIEKIDTDSIIAEFKDLGIDSFPLSDTIYKIITYKAKNVHDFAWFADKRFNVLKSSILTPKTKKRIITWAMFTNNNFKLWRDATTYINDALMFYSQKVGDYEYPNCIAIDGSLGAGGGMEYPGITNIGNVSSKLGLETVIMHEVGHNWFYSMLASNERKNPWIDEGMNSFIENRYILNKYPDSTLTHKFLFGKNNYQLYMKAYFEYFASATLNIEQKATLPSEKFLGINYGTIVYAKVAYIFIQLMSALGEENFDNIMTSFFQKYKNKHVFPEDIRSFFEQHTNKNLDWFFDDLLNSTKHIDYKISSLKKDDMNYKYKITNKAQIASPFSVSEIKNDSIISTTWYDGVKKSQIFETKTIDFEKIQIDAIMRSLEINKTNNTIKRNGIFKQIEPIKLRLFGLNNPDKSDIFILPAVGWNNYNKYMLGAMIYNDLAPVTNLTYRLIPMYSYTSTNIAGSMAISYKLPIRSDIFRNIKLNFDAKQYAFTESNKFNRFAGNINFLLLNTFPDGIKNNINISSVLATNLLSRITTDKEKLTPYYKIQYQSQRNKLIAPYNYNISLEISDGFAKSTFTGKYKINYNTSKKGFEISGFAGKFLYNKTNNPFYNFRLSGISGIHDYTYQNLFLGRTETDISNILSHQFVSPDGTFKTANYIQSNDWLISINASTSLPTKAPFKLYASIATYKYVASIENNKLFSYEAGLEMFIVKDKIQIFFPLLYSKSINNMLFYTTTNYFQKIRFTFNINEIFSTKYLKTFKDLN